MNAVDQYRLLKRIEWNLEQAMLAARQLPGCEPLERKLHEAQQLASAWRCDQEAELPSEACAGEAQA